MLSPNAPINTRLVDYSFIAGINPEEIDYEDLSKALLPKCLLGYPENLSDRFSEIAALVYPVGASILPKQAKDDITFYTTVLTNEKAHRSYIYVLKMYDNLNAIKTPIAICLCSSVNDTDSFKQLLNEIYMILSSDYSILTKQIELINYFMYVHSILIPPHHSSLILNMRNMTVNFSFNSLYEIPLTPNNTSISILFNVLDVSKIIKLWLNVLRENRIIIYGNKPYLLNAICDAITKLIFPFKWQHPYMSCLPKEQIDMIDSPCPCLFGILSSMMDIKTLCVNQKDFCIVDLETGQIFARKVTRLPREEEIKLRKKLQYVKNPELFKVNELFKGENENFFDEEHLDLAKPFSYNVQSIFFHILKRNLNGYRKHIVDDNKIDSNAFLNAIEVFEMRVLWKKIVNTSMFDIFVQESQYTDSLYNLIFDNLCNKSKPNKDESNAFKIEITMKPFNSSSLSSLVKELKLEGELQEKVLAYLNETKGACKFNRALRKRSTRSLAPFQNFSNAQYSQLIPSEESKDDNANEDNDAFFNQIVFSSSHSESDDDADNKEMNSHKKEDVMILKKNASNRITLKLLSRCNTKTKVEKKVSSMNLSSGRLAFINTIEKTTTVDEFSFTSEDGFIAFMNRMIKVYSESSVKLIDFFFKRDLMKEILFSSIKLKASDKPIEAIKEESNTEEKKLSEDKAYAHSLFLKGLKHRSNTKRVKFEDEQQQDCFIVKLDHDDNDNKFQKHLFYAFYLEELVNYSGEVFQCDAEEVNKRIMSFYHTALKEDSVQFPYKRYSSLLNRVSIPALKQYRSDERLRPVSILIQDTIHFFFKQFRELPYASQKRMTQLESKMPLSLVEDNVKKISVLLEMNSLNLFQSKLTMNSITKYNTNEIKPSLDLAFSKTNHKRDKLQETKQKKEETQSPAYYSLSKPTIINNQIRVSISYEPLPLMLSIAHKLLRVKDTYKNKRIKVKDNKDFTEITDLISHLQRVNLGKLISIYDQYSFWLNAFNCLLLSGCIFTNFYPKSFAQWNQFMTNCEYNIGGYEMSLYEIEAKILNCCNFHHGTIAFTDALTQKFCIFEKNILLNFALFFPIKLHLFELKVYSSDDFEEELYYNTQEFFRANLRYNKENNEIVISEYFELIYPHFIREEHYRRFLNYIAEEVYSVIENKKFSSIEIEQMNWRYCL